MACKLVCLVLKTVTVQGYLYLKSRAPGNAKYHSIAILMSVYRLPQMKRLRQIRILWYVVSEEPTVEVCVLKSCKIVTPATTVGSKVYQHERIRIHVCIRVHCHHDQQSKSVTRRAASRA